MRKPLLIFLFFIPLSLWAASEVVHQEGNLILSYDKANFTYTIQLGGRVQSQHIVKDYQQRFQFLQEFNTYEGNPQNLNKVRRYASQALRDEAEAASDESLIQVSMMLSKESESLVSKKPEDDCEKDQDTGEEQEQQEEFFCFCELPKEIQKKFEEQRKEQLKFEGHNLRADLIGKRLWQEYDLGTGNDNFGHGLFQVLDDDDYDGEGLKEYDGDDRGRTYSTSFRYKEIGERGEWRLGFDNTLFTTLSLDPEGKQEKEEDGKVKQYPLEQTILDGNYRRFNRERAEGEGRRNYVLLGARYEYETDEGFLSQKAQDEFHYMTRDLGQVEYSNQKHLFDDDHTFNIYSGVGREWVKNMGHWKCRSMAEVKVGAGRSSRTGSQYEGGVRGELQLNSGKSRGRDEDNPWFILSVWGESLYNTEDKESSNAGIEISSSFRKGKWTVRPYIGIEYHDTANDRFFGAHEGGESEVYHTLGVRITRRHR